MTNVTPVQLHPRQISLHKIWTYRPITSGSIMPTKAYAPTAEGLEDALAAATDGDMVQIPIGTIAGDFDVPTGVSLVGMDRKNSVLTGQVSLESDSSIDNLTINRTITSGTGTELLFVGPSSGSAYIFNSDLSIISSTENVTPYIADSIHHTGLRFYESNFICKKSGVDSLCFRPVNWNFDEDTEGWEFKKYSSPSGSPLDYQWIEPIGGLGYWSDGKLWINQMEDYYVPDVMWVKQFPRIICHTGDDIIWKYGRVDEEEFFEDDRVALFVKFTDNIEPYYWHQYQSQPGGVPTTGSYVMHMQGFEGKEIEYVAFGALYGQTCYLDDITIENENGISAGNVFHYSCSGSKINCSPIIGDQSSVNALSYPRFHANDIDYSGSAIHHTLGTSGSQAAPGDHTHILLHDPVSVTSSTSIDLWLNGSGSQTLSGSVIAAGIKLDDLGTPDNNTDLNATTAYHGLMPMLDNDISHFLNGQGTWTVVSASDGDAIHDNISGEINAISSEKTTPISADLIIIEDSADGYNKKKVQIGNLPGNSGSSTSGSSFTRWEPDAPPISTSGSSDEFDDSSFDTDKWTTIDPDGLLGIEEDNKKLHLSYVESTGENIAGIYQSIFENNFTLETKVSLAGYSEDISKIGIAFWEDPIEDLAIQTFALAYTSGSIFVEMGQWDDYLTENVSSPIIHMNYGNTTLYLRVTRSLSGDDPFYSFLISSDGIGYYRLYDGLLSFTPTKFGLFIDASNEAVGHYAFFRYTSNFIDYGEITEGKIIS